MFMKGEGTLKDIGDEKNLATSGRRYMAEILLLEIANKPWWGHGANASEELIVKLSEGQLTHPHNDWLRFLYDYGIVGTSLFLLSMLLQVRHLLKKARHSEGEIRSFFSATASSFLPFVLIMFTDNIVLYAAFYGNLQFTIIGLAYAAEKRGRLEKVSYDDDEFYELPSSRTTRSIAYREEDAPPPTVSTEAPTETETNEDSDR
jgi:O-antigen ligase